VWGGLGVVPGFMPPVGRPVEDVRLHTPDLSSYPRVDVGCHSPPVVERLACSLELYTESHRAFWYAAPGATVQILLFGILAIER